MGTRYKRWEVVGRDRGKERGEGWARQPCRMATSYAVNKQVDMTQKCTSETEDDVTFAKGHDVVR